MGKKDMVLYWGSGSSTCWRAMIALEEKGFAISEIESKLLSFDEKGHQSKEVLALNPRGQFPAFKDGDIVINESLAICLYLERAYPNEGNKLIPTEPKEFAEVYQRAIEIHENLQSKVMMKCLFYQLMTPEKDRDQELLKKSFQAGRDELLLWEKFIGESDFVCGGNFSLADVVLFTYVATFMRFGLSFSDLPNLQRYYDKLSERPSIKNSWPPHWKEGPCDEKKQLLKNM